MNLIDWNKLETEKKKKIPPRRKVGGCRCTHLTFSFEPQPPAGPTRVGQPARQVSSAEKRMPLPFSFKLFSFLNERLLMWRPFSPANESFHGVTSGRFRFVSLSRYLN